MRLILRIAGQADYAARRQSSVGQQRVDSSDRTIDRRCIAKVPSQSATTALERQDRSLEARVILRAKRFNKTMPITTQTSEPVLQGVGRRVDRHNAGDSTGSRP